MSKTINSFTAGELSRRTRNRTDVSIYHQGCSIIENMEVCQTGGVRRRKGMQKVLAALSENSRLIPFAFSKSETALLEFAPGLLRVLVNGEEKWKTTSVVWTTAEMVQSIRYLQMNDIVILYSELFAPQDLRRLVPDNTIWQLQNLKFDFAPDGNDEITNINLDVALNSRTLTAASGIFTEDMANRGQTILVKRRVNAYTMEYSLKFTSSSLPTINSLANRTIGVNSYFKQYRDGRYYYYSVKQTFLPGNYNGSDNASIYPNFFEPGVKLNITSNPFIAQGQWSATPDGTRRGKWKLCRTYKASMANASSWWDNDYSTIATIDASLAESTTFYEQEPAYIRVILLESETADDLGKLIIRTEPFHLDYQFNITSYISPTQAGINIAFGTIAIISPTDFGQFNPWSDFSAYSWSFGAFGSSTGYPIAASFHQNRLWFAGTASNPQTVWASKAGDVFNFQVTTQSDSAINLTLASTGYNAIQWIEPLRGLCIGTTEGEWNLNGTNGVISAATAGFERQSSVGSAFLPAISIENGLVYAQRDGKRLWQYYYANEAGGYLSEELTIFADHILDPGLREITYQRTPERVLWCVLHDGTIATMTYNYLQNVKAWSRIHTEGQVKSIAALPSATSSRDDIWLIVTRTDGTWIETINETSPYLDNASRDAQGNWQGIPYTSTLVTTAMDTTSTLGKKENAVVLMADYLDTPNTRDLEISIDGQHWAWNGRSEHHLDGWYEMTAKPGWNRSIRAGIRTKGDQPLELLAIRIDKK